MAKSVKEMKTCPACGSLNIVRVEERDEVICKDCGIVSEPIATTAKMPVHDWLQEANPKTTINLGSFSEKIFSAAQEPVKKVEKKSGKKKAVKGKKKPSSKKSKGKKSAKKSVKKKAVKKSAKKKSAKPKSSSSKKKSSKPKKPSKSFFSKAKRFLRKR